MTDLQRLIAYAQGERFCTARESSEMGNEIARILSVLLRVREGCRIRFAAADTDSAGCTIPAELEFTGPADTLRDLDELLNPSRTNKSGADSDVATGRHFSEARGLFKNSEYSQSNHVGDLDELLEGE